MYIRSTCTIILSEIVFLYKNALFCNILPKRKAREHCCGFSCPVEATIQLIGGKYKAVILWHLMNKTLRYNEIHKLIPKATDKMLAQQLRELEKDGLINRKVYPVVPPKTEYSLTKFGETLTPILDELCNWGEQYLIQK